MSNGDTRVDVTSEGSYHLGLALDLAMIYYTGPNGLKRTVSHWQEIDGNLVFSWNANSKGHALPAECDRDMLIPIIMAWLSKQDYGEEPDIDGSCSKGWRLKSHWSLMPDHPGRFYFQFTISPEFLEYHK